MTAIVAYFDWYLEVQCPHCCNDIDLTTYDENIPSYILTNRWSLLEGYNIVCPHCEKEFNLDKVEH